MNALEDAFWTARARGLANQRGGRGRAAILVRRGRALGERIAQPVQGPWSWIRDALGDHGGGTLYLSFTPSAHLLEEARSARLHRIVTPIAEIAITPLDGSSSELAS